MAWAKYGAEGGLTLKQIQDELLNDRDLCKKGSRKHQVKYPERTANLVGQYKRLLRYNRPRVRVQRALFPKNAAVACSPLCQVLRMSGVKMPPDRVQLTRTRSLGNSVAAL